MGSRMSKLGWVVSVGVLFSLVACGDDSAPPPTPRDGGRDGSMDASSCVICGAPPEGCSLVGGTCESCGTLVCDDGAVPPIDGGTDPFDANPVFFDGCATPLCPPLSTGCRYEGATECECGTLVCECGDGECSGTQVCRFTSGCAGAGTCTTRPTVCDDGVDPVCGCNGATYNNACDAEAAGVSVAAEGPCPDVEDCRDGECPIGTRCLGCPEGGSVTFACLPNDIDC
jgi:hypothetical protein